MHFLPDETRFIVVEKDRIQHLFFEETRINGIITLENCSIYTMLIKIKRAGHGVLA